jgi:hypothetical protein
VRDMKRGMVGGAYRGPVGVGRQRRTIRMIQGVLVLIAAGLLMFAGYSMGESAGYDRGQAADSLDASEPPGASQTVVLAILGVLAFSAALLLQTEGGVRLLTPKKLLELETSGGAEPIAMDQPAEKEPAENP